jgi:hypothetical protein
MLELQPIYIFPITELVQWVALFIGYVRKEVYQGWMRRVENAEWGISLGAKRCFFVDEVLSSSTLVQLRCGI